MLTPFLSYLALALAPAIPISNTSPGALDHARSLWLLGCLTVVTGWLAFHEPWLACIGLWFLCRWRTGDEPLGAKPVAALVSWAGVGVTWWAARSLPRELLTWLPWAWIALAWAQAALMAYQHWHRPDPQAFAYGWLGQRSIAAGLYVLTLPFCPWWALPGPLIGLWLTGPAWGATLALIPALLWVAPQAWLIGLLPALSVVLLAAWFVPFRGQRLIHLTPRGGSLDSLRARWTAIRVTLEELQHERRWLWGAGPGTMPLTIRRWHGRLRNPAHYIPRGDLHLEPLQVVYEYGLFGVAAMACFAYQIGGRMAWGDPWSAACLGGAVFACTTYGLRVAPLGVLWLAVAAGVGR